MRDPRRFTEAKPERKQPVTPIPFKTGLTFIMNYPVLFAMLCFVGIIVLFLNPVTSPHLQAFVQGGGERIAILLLIPLVFSIWAILVQQLLQWRRIVHKWTARDGECLAWESIMRRHKRNSVTWVLQTLCEYQDGQQRVRVTPTVAGTTWFTQAGTERFLNTRVAGDGACRLAVNPDNALEAWLLPYDTRTIFLVLFFCFVFSAGLGFGIWYIFF